MTGELTDAPAGYDVLLPPGWWSVPADPVGARGSIRKLLDARLAEFPRDTVQPVRMEVERMLHELVGNAQELGAMDVLITVDPLRGLPVTASCLVMLVPGTQPVSLDEIRAEMAEDADEHAIVELAAGPALRVRRRREPLPERTDDMPATVVEHVLPVPGTSDHMALVWSTPVDQLADEFVMLFDAVAGTLRWRWADA